MKIGLNATCFNDRPSGARQRLVGIYGELIKRMPESDFVIFEPVDCRIAKWFNGLPNVSITPTSVPSEGRLRKFVAGSRYWLNKYARDELDIFEVFHLPLTRKARGKTILTIHDLRGMDMENGVLDRTVFKKFLGRSLKTADHVVTVSDAMKNEILGFFPGIPISVIYNGLDTSGFEKVAESDMEAFRIKYGLPEGFVLAVGHFEKRKNYLRLIDAMALLRDRGIVCPLLIIGNDSGERLAVKSRCNEANLADNVKTLSGLTDHEVCCAYKLCSLFVFPSSYEGFGIPILEAMAAQRPMVLSDLPVFREITQNKGIYFPHDDVEAMAHVIEIGLSSSNERTRLIKMGAVRIKDFSFSNLAAQVEALYRAIQ